MYVLDPNAHSKVSEIAVSKLCTNHNNGETNRNVKSSGSVIPARTATNIEGYSWPLVSSFLFLWAVYINAATIAIDPTTLTNPNWTNLKDSWRLVTESIFAICANNIFTAPWYTSPAISAVPPSAV